MLHGKLRTVGFGNFRKIKKITIIFGANANTTTKESYKPVERKIYKNLGSIYSTKDR